MGKVKRYFKVLFIVAIIFISICGCSKDNKASRIISENDILENINNNIEYRNNEFNIRYTQSTESFKNVIDRYIKNLYETDPYLKSSIVSLKWKTEENKNDKIAIFNVEYIESKEEEEKVEIKVKEIIANSIKDCMSTIDKVRAVEDYIKVNINVDEDLSNSSVYSALIDGKTNSIGFSRLTYRILKEINIESKVINGKVYGNNHSWNLVNIDGTWLHLDITGDKLFKGKYFLVTDEAIRNMGYHWE